MISFLAANCLPSFGVLNMLMTAVHHTPLQFRLKQKWGFKEVFVFCCYFCLLQAVTPDGLVETKKLSFPDSIAWSVSLLRFGRSLAENEVSDCWKPTNRHSRHSLCSLWMEGKKKKPFAKVNAQMRFGCIKMANVPDHTAYVRFDTTTGVQVHLLLQRGQWVRKWQLAAGRKRQRHYTSCAVYEQTPWVMFTGVEELTGGVTSSTKRTCDEMEHKVK